MKRATKAILFVLFISLSLSSFSQLTLGVKGGLNLTNMLWKDNDDTYSKDYKMAPGMHLGATVAIPLVKDMLYLEPGLFFNMRGFRIDEELEGATVKGHLNLYYLDVPVNVMAIFGSDKFKFYGALGPYVGIGLSGKAKITAEYDGNKETTTETMKWGSDEDNDDFKRLDFGASIGAGVIISGIQIGLSYDMGLANISPYTDNGYRIKNRGLRLSVGYRLTFGSK
jgi:hypothetical protein